MEVHLRARTLHPLLPGTEMASQVARDHRRRPRPNPEAAQIGPQGAHRHLPHIEPAVVEDESPRQKYPSLQTADIPILLTLKPASAHSVLPPLSTVDRFPR